MAHRKRILGLVVLVLSFALAGCELVADFDRDQIPLPDTGMPAATPDAGTPDAMAPIPVMDAAAPDQDGGADDVDAGPTADAAP